MFILAIIVAILAVIGFVVAGRLKKAEQDRYYRGPDRGSLVVRIIATGLIIASGLIGFGSVTYTQQAGEAKVLKDWTGNVVDESVTTGLHLKAPWITEETFNTRNQTAAFIGKGDHDFNGTQPLGAQITVTDREGVSADLDLVVMYSLKPTAVREIYTQYRNQDAFEKSVVAQEIRTVTRQIPSGFGTMELLNGREKLATQIKDKLGANLDRRGVVIESVSLQEVRYSESVRKRFDDAQAARIAVEKSKADLQKAEIDAKQKVVQAESEAEANRKLAASLTEPILRQRYIDALSKAQFMVVPEGSNNLINVPGAAK